MKEFRSSDKAIELDDTASFTSQGNFTFEVVCPEGASRRQVGYRVYHAFCKLWKSLEVEASQEALALAKQNAAYSTMTEKVAEVWQEFSQADEAEKLGLVRPTSVLREEHLQDFVAERYGKLYSDFDASLQRKKVQAEKSRAALQQKDSNIASVPPEEMLEQIIDTRLQERLQSMSLVDADLDHGDNSASSSRVLAASFVGNVQGNGVSPAEGSGSHKIGKNGLRTVSGAHRPIASADSTGSERMRGKRGRKQGKGWNRRW